MSVVLLMKIGGGNDNWEEIVFVPVFLCYQCIGCINSELEFGI